MYEVERHRPHAKLRGSRAVGDGLHDDGAGANLGGGVYHHDGTLEMIDVSVLDNVADYPLTKDESSATVFAQATLNTGPTSTTTDDLGLYNHIY